MSDCQRRLRWVALAAWLACTAVLPACAGTATYVRNRTPARVELVPSPHRFDYVIIDQRRDHLIVYGKVKYEHHRLPDAHVDLAVVDRAGTSLATRTLLLQASGGRHGWSGAHFRAGIPLLPERGSRLRLAFHDQGVVAGQLDDCGANAAAAAASE
jgi:hypothetical protein